MKGSQFYIEPYKEFQFQVVSRGGLWDHRQVRADGVISYFAAFWVVGSVRQQEGDGLQLANAGGQRYGWVIAAGQHRKVMRGDGDVGARHKPRVNKKAQTVLFIHHKHSEPWTFRFSN